MPSAGPNPPLADVRDLLQLDSCVALCRHAWANGRPSARALAPAHRSDALVAAMLGQTATDSAGWLLRDPQGRPRLPATTDLDLSISHSGDCWLMALSAAGRRVGVDIESPRALPRALELAARYFSPSEVAILRRMSEASRARAFLRLWCAREAILKAHGRGIAFGLARIQLGITPKRLRIINCDPELGDVKAWRLREFVPAPGILGVVAWQGPPAVLRGFSCCNRDDFQRSAAAVLHSES